MSFSGVLAMRGSAVTLERPSQTVVAGVATVVWTPLATVQAHLEGIGGEDAGLVPEATYRILIAYRTDVTPRMRVGLGSRKFEVLSAVPDPRRLLLEIFAKELLS